MSHFIIDAVLAVTPVGRDGNVLTGWHVQRDQRGEDLSSPTYGDPEPIAAAQGVAVLRALTKDYPSDSVMPMSILSALADELEAEHV